MTTASRRTGLIRHFRQIAVALAAVLICATTQVEAASRLALVIGNNAYKEVDPLDRAVADARAYRKVLEDQRGFRVFYAEDAGRREMNHRVSEFLAAIRPGDTAMIVYSGHGVQLDSQRRDSLYLLPVDFPNRDPGRGAERLFFDSESLNFARLAEDVASRGAKLRIYVLDACRNNPFNRADGTRAIGVSRGIGRITSSSGEFVIYAAAPGEVAFDSLPGDTTDSGNSLFTRAFIKHFKTGTYLEDVANDVQAEVVKLARAANVEQEPYYSDGVAGRTCLEENCGSVISEDAKMAKEREELYWKYCEENEQPDYCRAFLDQYPESWRAGLAQARLKVLAERARRRKANGDRTVLNRKDKDADKTDKKDASADSTDGGTKDKKDASADSTDGGTKDKKPDESTVSNGGTKDTKPDKHGGELHAKKGGEKTPRDDSAARTGNNGDGFTPTDEGDVKPDAKTSVDDRDPGADKTGDSDLPPKTGGDKTDYAALDPDGDKTGNGATGNGATDGVKDDTKPDIDASTDPITPTRDQLRDVQVRLTVLGHRPGPIDGLMGKRTRRAIRAFQKSEEMEQDGAVSEALIALLVVRVPDEALTEYNEARAAAIRRQNEIRRDRRDRRRAINRRTKKRKTTTRRDRKTTTKEPTEPRKTATTTPPKRKKTVTTRNNGRTNIKRRKNITKKPFYCKSSPERAVWDENCR